MPEFHAVQCYECSTFQVQQVKKVNKFTCKLCGQKQSVRRAYAASTKASDVRQAVQQLNLQRAANESCTVELEDVPEESSLPVPIQSSLSPKRARIAWEGFLHQEEAPMKTFEGSCAGVTTELPEKPKQGWGRGSSSKRTAPRKPRLDGRGTKRAKWPSENEEDFPPMQASKASQRPRNGQEALLLPRGAEGQLHGAAGSSQRCVQAASAAPRRPECVSVEVGRPVAISKWAAYEAADPEPAKPLNDTNFSKQWSECKGSADSNVALLWDF